tara:strand:- start:16795 stop:17808 length:1014 start_codon:yes stop_codon:yes gene_type:complete
MIHNVDLTKARQNILQKKAQFAGQKILVLGDLGLDEYVTGEVDRISPEAPVPVLAVKEEYYRLGLSTNVALNIKAMGGEPLLVSVIGDDIAGEKVRALLKEAGIQDQFVLQDKNRPTTRKARIMSGSHHMVRVDYEEKTTISSQCQKEVLDLYRQALQDCSAVIIQDYAKGLIGADLNADVIKMAKAKGVAVYVDPHPSKSPQTYQNAFLMTPNLKEAAAMMKWQKSSSDLLDEEVLALGKELQAAIQSEALIITRSKDGMTLFENDILQVPTFAKQVYDVTGAGDTVIAAIAMAQAAGLSLQDACVFANYAAGVVVAKVGAATANWEEIMESMDSH